MRAGLELKFVVLYSQPLDASSSRANLNTREMNGPGLHIQHQASNPWEYEKLCISSLQILSYARDCKYHALTCYKITPNKTSSENITKRQPNMEERNLPTFRTKPAFSWGQSRRAGGHRRGRTKPRIPASWDHHTRMQPPAARPPSSPANRSASAPPFHPP